MTELELYRMEIDCLDQKLAQLFAHRMEVTAKVASYKMTHSIPVTDPVREATLLEQRRSMVEGTEQKEDITLYFESIMAISRAQQRRIMAKEGEME